MGIPDEKGEPPRLVKSWDLRAFTGKETKQKVNTKVAISVATSPIPAPNLSAFRYKWQLADQRILEAHDPCVPPGAVPQNRKWHRVVRNFTGVFSQQILNAADIGVLSV